MTLPRIVRLLLFTVAIAPQAGVRAQSSTQAVQESGPRYQPFKTVWAGVYTGAEADRGRQAYAQLCARCHGADRKGSASAPGLIGSKFFDRWHDLRLGDLIAYIQAAMPREHEFYIPPDKTREIVALLLQESGLPAGREPITSDVKTLSEILITRRPPAGQDGDGVRGPREIP